MIRLTTDTEFGIAYKDQGWFPPQDDKITVYNKVLQSFIFTLKPLDNVSARFIQKDRHQELLLAILKACPELVIS